MIRAMNYYSSFIILGFSVLATLQTHAALPGIYLGGQLGWGFVNESGISRQNMGNLIASAVGHDDFTIQTFQGTTNGDGFAGRVFAGYQIGCHAAIELGWAKFNSLPVKATATELDLTTGVLGTVSTSGTLKIDAFDIIAKGILPLRYHFNVYGKLGAAYLQGRSNASAAVTEAGIVSLSDSINDITNRVFPTFGVGVAYDFRPDIEMDLSWSRIQKIRTSEALGSVDFISLGLTLHFDKFGWNGCC